MEKFNLPLKEGMKLNFGNDLSFEIGDRAALPFSAPKGLTLAPLTMVSVSFVACRACFPPRKKLLPFSKAATPNSFQNAIMMYCEVNELDN